jgi:hypothetical protein
MSEELTFDQINAGVVLLLADAGESLYIDKWAKAYEFACTIATAKTQGWVTITETGQQLVIKAFDAMCEMTGKTQPELLDMLLFSDDEEEE